jgi:hypothetical protein
VWECYLGLSKVGYTGINRTGVICMNWAWARCVSVSVYDRVYLPLVWVNIFQKLFCHEALLLRSLRFTLKLHLLLIKVVILIVNLCISLSRIEHKFEYKTYTTMVSFWDRMIWTQCIRFTNDNRFFFLFTVYFILFIDNFFFILYYQLNYNFMSTIYVNNNI